MKLCIAMKDNETTITSDAGMEYKFVYDYSIWSCDPKDPNYVGQEKLYELMGRPLLNSAFEGYNTCLFAYGQVYTCMLWFKFIFDFYFSLSYTHYHNLKQREIKIKLV